MMIIAAVFNFLVVVGVLLYFGRKPTADYLAQRRETVSEAMEEARRLSEQAQAELSLWKGKWSGAEREITDQRHQYEDMLIRQREMMKEHLKNEGVRISHETSLIAQSERARARQALGKELAHRSIETAKEYLKSHLEERDRQRLVTEYLEIMKNGQAG